MKAFKREGDYDMKDESRIVRIETVIEHIQYVLDRMDKRFDSLEQTLEVRFNKIDERFNKIDLKFEKIEDRFHDLHKESKIHFRWLMAFGVAILGSPLVISLINYFHSVKI